MPLYVGLWTRFVKPLGKFESGPLPAPVTESLNPFHGRRPGLYE